MKKQHIVLLSLVLSVLFSCKKEKKEVVVDPDPLVGVWSSEKIEIEFYTKSSQETTYLEEFISTSTDFQEYTFKENGEMVSREVEEGEDDEIVTGTYVKVGNKLTLKEKSGISMDFEFTINGNALRLVANDMPFSDIDIEDMIEELADEFDIPGNDIAFEVRLLMRKKS